MTTVADHSRRDVGALSGLLFAVVTLATIFVTGIVGSGERPRPTAPDTVVQDFILDNSGMLKIQAFAGVVGGMLLVLFAVSLAAMLRRAENAENRTSGAVEATLVGGTLAAAFWVMSALLISGLSQEMISDSPALVSALRMLNFLTGGSGHVIWLAVMMGPASLAAHRLRLLPRWLTTAGIVCACLSLISLGSLASDVFFLFIPLGRFSAVLVIAVASVLMATGRVGRVRSGHSVRSSVLGGVGVVILGFALTIFI